MGRLFAIACVAGALAVAAVASATAASPRAPAAVGPDVRGGGTASLAALRGKPVFVNVWSSW